MARCPGHNVMVWTGPGEDDYDPDLEYCDGSCTIHVALDGAA